MGLVLSALGCSALFGLVVSVIARSKSRKAGYPGRLALAGIVVGSLMLVVLIVVGALIAFDVRVFGDVRRACEGLDSGALVVINAVVTTCP